MKSNAGSVSFLIRPVVLLLFAYSSSWAGDHPKSAPKLPAASQQEDCGNVGEEDIVVIVRQKAGTVEMPEAQGGCKPYHNEVVTRQNLTYHSDGEQVVRIRFHLDKELQHAAWKADRNDSIWLADDKVKPSATTVPECMKKKDVSIDGRSNRELFFTTCTRKGNDRNIYVLNYVLRMDQTLPGRKRRTIIIDPQIINAPYTTQNH
ncbi:MAG TPA: hypothetical protein VGD63_00760 [Steroidobacteraceae bacterium]